MIKGPGELVISEATVRAAIEMWIDRHLTRPGPIEVLSVHERKDGQFRVAMTERRRKG